MMSKELELLQKALEWMEELNYVWLNSRISGDSIALELIADINKVEQLLAQPEREQEPVAWFYERQIEGFTERTMSVGFEENFDGVTIPLYLEPPKREPLSDEHLISAAPELLEALENWINALDDPSEWMKCRDDANKAIEKAHGIGVDDE